MSKNINSKYFESKESAGWFEWIVKHTGITNGVFENKQGMFFQLAVPEKDKNMLYMLMDALQSTYKITHRLPRKRYFKNRQKHYTDAGTYQVTIYNDELCISLLPYKK